MKELKAFSYKNMAWCSTVGPVTRSAGKSGAHASLSKWGINTSPAGKTLGERVICLFTRQAQGSGNFIPFLIH
jgi:hypothetical protein